MKISTFCFVFNLLNYLMDIIKSFVAKLPRIYNYYYNGDDAEMRYRQNSPAHYNGLQSKLLKNLYITLFWKTNYREGLNSSLHGMMQY